MISWFGKKKDEKPAPVTASEPVPEMKPVEPAPAAAPAPAPAAAAPSPIEPIAVPPPPAPAAPAAAPAAPAVAAEPPPAEPEEDPANDRKALYYSFMNALYDAVLVVDNSGHIMDSNERVESVFGYTNDDLWDMAITQLVPGVNAVVFAKMRSGLSGNRRVIINARCRRKDGTMFPGEVGVGIMALMGDSLVFSIRNIEKRAPAKAVVRVAAKTQKIEL